MYERPARPFPWGGGERGVGEAAAWVLATASRPHGFCLTSTEMFITMFIIVFTLPAAEDPPVSGPGGRRLWLLRNNLASYVRPFPRDFSHLARLIAEGRSVGRDQ